MIHRRIENFSEVPNGIAELLAREHVKTLQDTVALEDIVAWLLQGKLEVWVTLIDDAIVAFTLCEADNNTYRIRDIFGLTAKQVVDSLLPKIRAHCALENYSILQVATLRRNLISALRNDGFVILVTLMSVEL